MRTRYPRWILLTSSLVALSALLLSGCAGKEVDDNDPAAVFKEAEQELANDHFQMAIDKFKMIRNRFPYSKFAIEAQLKIADAYFMQEAFPEAAASYETFRDLHPKHEKTAYATFRIGKSYYGEIPGNIAKDLGPATRALEAYMEFLSRYPKASEAAEAKKDVAEIRGLLADKENYIGDYYLKRDMPEAASQRYKKVMELYPETEAAKQAEKKLAKADKKVNDGK